MGTSAESSAPERNLSARSDPSVCSNERKRYIHACCSCNAYRHSGSFGLGSTGMSTSPMLSRSILAKNAEEPRTGSPRFEMSTPERLYHPKPLESASAFSALNEKRGTSKKAS